MRPSFDSALFAPVSAKYTTPGLPGSVAASSMRMKLNEPSASACSFSCKPAVGVGVGDRHESSGERLALGDVVRRRIAVALIVGHPDRERAIAVDRAREVVREVRVRLRAQAERILGQEHRRSRHPLERDDVLVVQRPELRGLHDFARQRVDGDRHAAAWRREPLLAGEVPGHAVEGRQRRRAEVFVALGPVDRVARRHHGAVRVERQVRDPRPRGIAVPVRELVVREHLEPVGGALVDADAVGHARVLERVTDLVAGVDQGRDLDARLQRHQHRTHRRGSAPAPVRGRRSRPHGCHRDRRDQHHGQAPHEPSPFERGDESCHRRSGGRERSLRPSRSVRARTPGSAGPSSSGSSRSRATCRRLAPTRRPSRRP